MEYKVGQVWTSIPDSYYYITKVEGVLGDWITYLKIFFKPNKELFIGEVSSDTEKLIGALPTDLHKLLDKIFKRKITKLSDKEKWW